MLDHWNTVDQLFHEFVESATEMKPNFRTIVHEMRKLDAVTKEQSVERKLIRLEQEQEALQKQQLQIQQRFREIMGDLECYLDTALGTRKQIKQKKTMERKLERALSSKAVSAMELNCVQTFLV